MQGKPNARVIWLVLAAQLMAALACGQARPVTEPTPVWTPKPLVESRSTATEESRSAGPAGPATATGEPAVPDASGALAAPETAAEGAAAEAAAAGTVAGTPGPGVLVITEEDIQASLASGIVGQQGLETEGLEVRFTDGKIQLSADRLAYGVLEVAGLKLVGKLAAQDGAVRLQTESIAPRGLVTAVIPTVVNNVLAQYSQGGYVQEVRVLDGRLEIGYR